MLTFLRLFRQQRLTVSANASHSNKMRLFLVIHQSLSIWVFGLTIRAFGLAIYSSSGNASNTAIA